KTSAPDGPSASRYLAGGNVVGVSWSAAITGLTFESVKASKGPQAMVDALLAATKLPAKADTPANRPLTKIYLWQFDSSKTSPLESIADANAFTSLGCREGDRVAWMSFSSVEGAEIANGLRRAGMVIVPVNYRLRGPEIAYVLNDSGARVAAAGPDHVEVMAAATGAVKHEMRFVAVGDRAPQGWRSYAELLDSAADEFASVSEGLGASMIYTSGTTGNPKGAWRPHGVDT